MGRHSGKVTHTRCRRCGKRTYHLSKRVCASCGYGKSAKLRSYNWNKKRKSKAVKRKVVVSKPKKKITKTVVKNAPKKAVKKETKPASK